MSMRVFQLGDIVEWSSQSAGIRTTKRGEIVAIVPSWASVENCTTFRINNPGMWRAHESYVIRASATGNPPLRTYWPVVSLLKKVAP